MNSNSTRNGSKRPHSTSNQQRSSSANDTSHTSSKIGRLNPSIANGNGNGDARTTDAAIYDSRTPTNFLSDLNELNRKLSANSNHLDNNQNPFLHGGKRVSVDGGRDDQSSFGHVDPNNLNNLNPLNSPSSNKFEIKESPKSALLDNRRLSAVNLTNYCPSIKLKGASFEPAQSGKLVSVPCPAGSTNAVSWYCSPAAEDGQRAMWYPKDRPDFSKCSSLWLNSMEERLKEKYVMISKLAQELATVTNLFQDTDQNLASQNSFLGIETPKKLNTILGNERPQQTLYARDLYRIAEIVASLVNKLETNIETNSDLNKFNENQRKKQSGLIHEMLTRIQDTISNLLDEQNRESWLELQSSERTLAISSLMTSLKRNALLFASVRSIVSSNFDRFTRNLCK